MHEPVFMIPGHVPAGFHGSFVAAC